VCHHPPNHLAGNLRSLRYAVTVGFVSSTSTSIAVVRGLCGVDEDAADSGAGRAARRVLAGGGTVTVEGGSVSVTVMVSIS